MQGNRPSVQVLLLALLSLSKILALSIPLLLTACGGAGGGSSMPARPTITSVTVVCSPGPINTNQMSTCTPTVSGTGNYSSTVKWSVSPTSIGTVSGTGDLTSACTGTATVSRIRSGNATVKVATPPTITSVSVVCSPASILTTQTSTSTGAVQGTGSYSSEVTWAASNGTITSSGVFMATVAGTVNITARSTQDATKSGG